MGRLSDTSTKETLASEWLLRAVRAGDPVERRQAAEAGLALLSTGLDGDTHVLLLRQIYVSYLEQRQLRRAAEIAAAMARLGSLRDIAHHDASRVLFALGDVADAILEQRRAARHAPPERRSFHLWGLATMQHFAGDAAGALHTLARASRHALRDRALVKAHAAYVRLDAGMPVRGLADILEELRGSPNREGYGQFLLGMIAHHMGDRRAASAHLRAFLRRNAAADPAKALTLREELRRARVVLAAIDAD